MPRSPLAFVTIAITLAACPVPKDKETSDDGAGDTTGGNQPSSGTDSGAMPPSPPPERPESMPLLCSLEDGKWCTGCPQGDVGPLCCTGEICVPWDADGLACDGVVGWCTNYTLDDSKSSQGLKLATCHDG